MPVCYGDEWLNVVVLMLNHWGTLPSHLIEDHIKPFLAPTLGVIAALGNNVVARIDAASGGEVWQKRVEPCLSALPACLVTAAPNGTMIFLPFMGGGGTSACCMLNAADGNEIWRRSSWMPGAVFAPSSQLLAGTGGKVLMLHADSGKELWERADILGSKVEFAPNSKTLAAAVDDIGSVVMLDAMSGNELWRHGPIAMVTDFLFSLNSQSLIVAAYTELSSLDVCSGNQLWNKEDLDSHSLLMDSDGEHILLGSHDAVVQINVHSGEELVCSTLNSTGKSPRAVSVKMVSHDSAIATRSNQLLVLDKKTWSASNIIPIRSDELVTASGNHLAAVLQEHGTQSLAMLTSEGELLWKWKGGCVDMCVRSMAFVIPPKATGGSYQAQAQAQCIEMDSFSSSHNQHQPQLMPEPVLASALVDRECEEVSECNGNAEDLSTSESCNSDFSQFEPFAFTAEAHHHHDCDDDYDEDYEAFSQNESFEHTAEADVLVKQGKEPVEPPYSEHDFYKVVFLGLILILLMYFGPHRLILSARASTFLLLLGAGCAHADAKILQVFRAVPASFPNLM